MQNTSDTQLPPVNPAANSTVKMTGNQCAEMASKIWKWVDRSESPAVLVLPDFEKFNLQPNENPIEVLDYGSMGEIRSAGQQVVVEWFDHDENPEPVFLLFEFDGNKAAQSFSKRLHRKKHQVLIAGGDCVRIVKITPSPKPATDSELGQRGVAAPNGVVHSGMDMTEVELNYYAGLPSESFDALVGQPRKQIWSMQAPQILPLLLLPRKTDCVG